MSASHWTALRAELAHWQAAGRKVPLWWRDDDAVTVTLELEQLLALSRQSDVPVHVAIIPAHADQRLADTVLTTSQFVPVIHGWAHQNHAPDGAKSSEFGTPRAAALADAEQGLARMRALMGPALVPLFVPPWNRIDATVTDGLVALGYTGLSTYGPRAAPRVAGLAQINTHIDPVDWRGTRGLAPQDVILGRLIAHLEDRRLGRADASEPLGLLTHHLMQDAETWAFCAALLTELRPFCDIAPPELTAIRDPA